MQNRIIVIVDDAAEDRTACRRYLRQSPECNYTILEADTGRKALDLCRDIRPDCILLDYRLPDMDGIEVLTSLTGGEGEAVLPVVMLTGADEISLAVEAMRGGAQDFINKNRLTPMISPLNQLDRFVSGDATRLQQAVWNLLSNAVKFTSRGGVVTVRLAQCGSDAEITVSDTGKGISPEFLPYVFDRFRQQDGSSTRAHGGMGLGLSIVKYMIEMHGGTVTACSDGPDKGSTFTLTLPLIEDVATQRQAVQFHLNLGQTTSPWLGGMSILVLDDDPDAREMVAVLLSTAGASVTTVSTAAEAMEAIRERKFAVLISDIAMPNEDGYVFIRQVRALGISTPAVALTAYGAEEDRRCSLAAGYQAHLAKPVEPRDIIAVLVELAGRECAGWCMV